MNPTDPTHDPFRDQLLAAQPTTPALREEYRRELDAIVNHRLTPRTRMFVWACIGGCAAFIALCLRSLLLYSHKPDVKITLPVFIVVALLLALWLGRVLWQGGFAWRSWFKVFEALGGTFAGVVVLVSLLGGMKAPSDPASTFSVLLALFLLMTGLAWSTGHRIDAAVMTMRESILRLESRVAEMAERSKRE